MLKKIKNINLFLIALVILGVICVANLFKQDNKDLVNYEIIDIGESDQQLIVNKIETEVTGIELKNVKITEDILVITSIKYDEKIIYVVDKNGHVISKLVGKSNDNLDPSYITLKGDTISEYKIEKNDIYITSSSFGEDFFYTVCISSDNLDRSVKYVEKFTYLKNGKLDEGKVVDSTTLREYQKDSDSVCFN